MVSVIILAAGKGTRMKDPTTPKVCQKVGGKTMIEHVVSLTKELSPEEISIIVSLENRSQIEESVKDFSNIIFIEQKEINGTASAVLSAKNVYEGKDILVLLGDVPFLKSETLKKVIQSECCTILGFCDEEENKFGRIIQSEGKLEKIVEYSEANGLEKQITSVNSGILFLKSEYTHLLEKIDNNNTKKEYYLTDIVKILREKGYPISYIEADKKECLGINTKEELKYANLL